ncbi:MAG TPA: hypothetical protein GXZ39_07665 [Bacteroidales bacterium]|nr:hypothetical protein [Bacteroidales bacterium]
MEVTSAEDLPLVVEKRPDSVVFNIPELRDDVNRQWETRFNDLLNECGCASGRSFIMYALPGLVLAFIYLVNFTDLGRYWSLGLFAGGVAVAGVAGKITGLLQRNRRLRKLLLDFSAATGQPVPQA